MLGVPSCLSVKVACVIQFDGLGKQYGEFAAVRDLTFSVAGGEVFGFLGPNGAGKTTSIRMLMGILVPSSGRASIDGLDCQAERVEVKRKVGYLPDSPIFYDFLRGREIVEFVGEMHGQSRPEAQANARAAAGRAGARGGRRGVRGQLLHGHEEEAGPRLRADPRPVGADPG